MTHRYEIQDHLGNIYPNLHTMLKKYGISAYTWRNRQKRGWSIKDTLTIPTTGKMRTPTYIEDHEGNKFTSVNAMCAHWHVKANTFRDRIDKGMTKEQALTLKGAVRDKLIKDHLGNTFANITEMCRAHGITKSIYKYREQKGLSLEEILTTPPERKYGPVTDHLGTIFPDMKSMCKHYDISESAYNYRIETGMTKEEALTKPKTVCNKKTIVDHLGNEYPTVIAMIKAHGLTKKIYQQRKKAGWDLERILTTPSRNRGSIQDIYGQTFSSLHQMCNHYNISVTTYTRREKSNYSLIERLNIIPLLNKYIKNWKFDDTLTVLSCTNDGSGEYFHVIFNHIETILPRTMLINHCTKQLQIQHQNAVAMTT